MKTIYYTHYFLMANIDCYASYHEMHKDDMSMRLTGQAYSYWMPRTVGGNLGRAKIDQAIAYQFEEDMMVERMAYERNNFEHTTLIRLK